MLAGEPLLGKAMMSTGAGSCGWETFFGTETAPKQREAGIPPPTLALGEASVAGAPLVCPLDLQLQEVNLSGARRPEEARRPGRGQDVPLLLPPS